jgi:hypothetical protein
MTAAVRTEPWYRRRARALLALLALLSVLAPAELLHFVLVQHVVCAEHGELVHESGVAHAAPAEGGGASGQGPGLHADAVAHDHEHCGVAAASREALALPPAPAVAAISAATSDALLSASRSAVSGSEALFRLAPKTSPPA